MNEKARPRACIYVQKDLQVALNPIKKTSHDIAACTIKIDDSTLMISNVYNAPTSFSGFEEWDRLMTNLPLTIQLPPTIVVTDSNLHSPVWNPIRNSTYDKAADELIETISKWGLRLRSPVGTPTYGLHSTTTRGTTIYLVWVTKQLYEIIKAFLVNPDDITNHFSDHQSLITTFSTTTQNMPLGKKTPAKGKDLVLTEGIEEFPTHNYTTDRAGQNQQFQQPSTHCYHRSCDQ